MKSEITLMGFHSNAVAHDRNGAQYSRVVAVGIAWNPGLEQRISGMWNAEPRTTAQRPTTEQQSPGILDSLFLEFRF